MSRVLITYEVFDQCNQTDFDELKGLLEACDPHHTICNKPESRIKSQDLEQCDMLVLIRPRSLQAFELAKTARRSGRFLVSFFDDDLMNLPNSRFIYRKRIRRILSVSNLLLGGNSLILSDYAPFMKRPRVARLPLFSTDIKNKIRPVSPASAPLQVLYAAGASHAHLFNDIVGPAMKPLLERYPDAFEFTFLGLQPNPAVFPSGAKIHLVSGMPYAEYTEFLKSNHFDLGLAPLLDNPFSNRKGLAKYIDYSLIGILGLYSNCLPYTNRIRSGETGLLVKNNPEDWFNAFSFCAEHPDEVKRMAKNAQDELLYCSHPEVIAAAIKNDAPEFFTLPKASKKVRMYNCRFARFPLVAKMNHAWDERLFPFIERRLLHPVSELFHNLSEQIKTRGFFPAIAYYIKKPFKRNA